MVRCTVRNSSPIALERDRFYGQGGVRQEPGTREGHGLAAMLEGVSRLSIRHDRAPGFGRRVTGGEKIPATGESSPRAGVCQGKWGLFLA